MKKILFITIGFVLTTFSSFAYVDLFNNYIRISSAMEASFNNVLFDTPDGIVFYDLKVENKGNGTQSIAQICLDHGYYISVSQVGEGSNSVTSYMDNRDSSIEWWMYVKINFLGIFFDREAYASIHLWEN